jgi:hypothetical protein
MATQAQEVKDCISGPNDQAKGGQTKQDRKRRLEQEAMDQISHPQSLSDEGVDEGQSSSA